MSDLKFIQETPSDELYKHHLKVVFKVYHELFGEVCTGCASKIAGYIKRIKNYKNSTIMSQKNKPKFVLKKGSQIIERGSSKSFSNANLTDEIAIAFLKKNPNRKVLFAKLPDNIDALLEAEETDEGKALSDYTVKELRELYPDAKGRSKDDLLESIQGIINQAATNAEAEETDEGKAGKKSDEEE